MAHDPTLARALQAPIADVYLVVGAEALLVERAVTALVDAVSPEIGPPAFNLSMHRAGDADAAEALGAARTLPMMAGRRLVVVRDLHEGSDAFFTDLESYLEAPSPSTTLVLAGTGWPTVRKGGRAWGSRIPKRVDAVGIVLKYATADADPVRFVTQAAADLGHALTSQDARLLVDLIGRDLGRLARELDKVSLYVGPGQPIDGAAIGAACSALAEKEVWDLTSGIAARDAEAALGALHRLLEQGDAPHHMLALVGWQLRTVLRVAELVRHKAPEDRIRAEVRMRPDQYQRVRRAVGRDTRGAAEMLERLARANRAMNSARSGDRRVLEALVIDLVRG
ncbi:MAG: DNA polymerase III subunit delta [Alphaproteobacteria bacterium]|nr:DNA polymerase III subunit delta [Alphaproteobacteria bacterium]